MTTPRRAPNESIDAIGSTAARRRRVPRSWITTVLITALVVSALVFSGGLDRRRLVTDLGGPQKVDLGPVIIDFRKAFYTLPSTQSEIEITVLATCQMTAKDAFNVGSTLSRVLYLPQLGGGGFGENPRVKFSWENSEPRNSIPSEMPPYECTFTFRVSGMQLPADTLNVSFEKLVWEDPYAVKFGTKSWIPDRKRVFVITLPLSEKPR